MPRPAAPDGRPELVVLRALKLGDLLVAVPALHALRRAYPGHRLVLAAPGWLGPLVDLIDAVDTLLPTQGLDDPLPLPAGMVDVAVNLHGRGPQSHRLLDRLAAPTRLGHQAPGWDGPPWREDLHERVRWARLVQAYGWAADPDEVQIQLPAQASAWPGAVVVHVGAAYGSREWPVDRFADVARVLARAGDQVLVTGGAEDAPRALRVLAAAGLPDEALLAGRTTLTELAALVAQAGLVVSADTGVAHLASAYGTPSVVLFGPAPPEIWGPPAHGPHRVLTDAPVRRGEVFSADPDPALLAVTVAQVLAAARELLAEKRHPGTDAGENESQA